MIQGKALSNRAKNQGANQSLLAHGLWST